MIIGAQLYTLKKYTQDLDSFADALCRVADIGYTAVQVSGTCEFEPEWLREQLKKNGLVCAVTHTKLPLMQEDPQKVCSDHKTFGCTRIGLGAMPGFVHDDTYVRDIFAQLHPVVDAFRANGCKFYYHNHQIDFNRGKDGRTYLEWMLEEFPAEDLGIIFDTYWAAFSGVNPAEVMRKELKGRLEVIHLKDMIIEGKEQRFAPVGSGNLNFDPILEAAEELGTQYLLVEQDKSYDDDPFDCLKKSYDFLRSKGLH